MKQTIKKGDLLKCTTLCKGLRIGTVYTALKDEKGGRVPVIGEHGKEFPWYATYFKVVTPATAVVDNNSPIKTTTPVETINMVETGFKAGHMIQCVNGPYQDITKFNTYQVIETQNGPLVTIVNDKGNKSMYNSASFRHVENQVKKGNILESLTTNNTLTAGQKYEALEDEIDGRIIIKNNAGKERGYLAKHFKIYNAEEDMKGRVRVLTMSNNKIVHDSPFQEKEEFTSHLNQEERPIIMGGTPSLPSFKGNEELEASEPHKPVIFPIEEKLPIILIEPVKAPVIDSIASPELQQGPRACPEGYEPFDYKEALKRPNDVFTFEGKQVELGGLNTKALRFHTLAGWVDGEITAWNIFGRYNEDGKDALNDLMLRIKMDVFYRNEYRFEELKTLGELAFTQYETLEEALDDEDLGPKAVMEITYYKDEFISATVVHKYPKK